MSSIFSGLADVLGPLSPNRRPLEFTRGYQQLHIGHVLDVILDQDSPHYLNDYGLGIVRVRFVPSDSAKGEDGIVVLAGPADRCNYQVPLPGEQVLVYSVLERGRRYYVYGSIIKQDLSTVFGSQPFLGTKPIFVNPLTLYAFADVPTLANRFNDKLQIPVDTYLSKAKLYTTKREGDTLIEGRFGAQIRFTSTLEEHKSLGENLLEIIQNKTPTIAGNEIVKPMLTEDGDPLTILQVSRKESVEEPTFTEKDIDTADSVVYLTSTQEIPMAINTSKRMASWDVEVLRQDPNQLKSLSDSIRLQSTFDGVYDPNFRFTVNLNLSIPAQGGSNAYDSFNPGNLTQGSKSANIKAIIARMNQGGITNPYAIAAYLGCMGKESGWVPQSELGYATTPATKQSPGRGLKELFGGRLQAYLAFKGKGYSNTDVEDLSGLSANKAAGTQEKLLQPYQTEFYDSIYGYLIKTADGYKGGNTNPGDGIKYRGRGLNQVTFKDGYKKKSDVVGIDLVANPDALNGVDVAVEVGVRFLTEVLTKTMKKDPNGFTSLDQAYRDLAAANHGGTFQQPAYDATKKAGDSIIAAGYVTGI